MEKSNRSKIEHETDAEFIAKGKNVTKDFDESEALFVPTKKKASRLISIRLPIDMIEKLYKVAATKNVMGYQQLIKTYISEALRNELFHIAQEKIEARVVLSHMRELFELDNSDSSSSSFSNSTIEGPKYYLSVAEYADCKNYIEDKV